ncbi:hypothetical protein [Streptomyces sp. NBC_00519]|uniref:hypothetical protein n=1 Tax=Streptomyces sp. NBC_00519 TaxID=2975764 RepID=UPI0030E5CB5A
MKKPLREPQAPPGPQHDFFDLLQRYVRRYGNKSLADLVSEGNIYCTRQALHRALVGPKLPSRKLVSEIVRAVNCTAGEEETVLSAYDAACDDQLEQSRRTERKAATVEPGRPALPHDSFSVARAERQFAQTLRELHVQAGSPPLRLLEQRGALDDPSVRLRPSTVSDWLNGKSIPSSGPAFRTLIRVLNELAGPQGRPLEMREAEMLRTAAAAGRRGGSEPPRMSAGSGTGAPRK